MEIKVRWKFLLLLLLFFGERVVGTKAECKFVYYYYFFFILR